MSENDLRKFAIMFFSLFCISLIIVGKSFCDDVDDKIKVDHTQSYTVVYDVDNKNFDTIKDNKDFESVDTFETIEKEKSK